ncbi:MAG TPA: heme-binding domain-containing protein, partial [Candidatus Aminicenantes bacterium]|nr:heme-binding domain-containing protein [Candidatus Aminicenantes bacterium]
GRESLNFSTWDAYDARTRHDLLRAAWTSVDKGRMPPAGYLAAHAEAGAPIDYTAHALDLFNVIAGISVACLILAFGLHVYGFKRGGKKAWLASEPIHHAPFFKQMYDGAEKRFFDLYEQGIKFLRGLSWILFKGIDRPIDAVYEKGVTAVGTAFTGLLRKAHNGHYANYLAWGLGGLVVLIALINVILK